jgi:hypothetical protein
LIKSITTAVPYTETIGVSPGVLSTTTIFIPLPEGANTNPPSSSSPISSSQASSAVSASTAPAQSTGSTTSSPSTSTSGSSSTATSATSTSTHTASSSSSKGLSNGAVAGVAIGTAIVGAVLALLIAFLLTRGRKSNKSSAAAGSRGINGNEAKYGPEYGAEDSVASRSGGNALVAGDLLERADDNDIRRSMQNLCEVIDQHSENFYHMEEVDAHSAGVERHLIGIGYSELQPPGVSIQDLTRLLLDPVARFSAVRYLIALFIINNIDWKANAETSLLPPYVAGILSKIPPAEREHGSQEGLFSIPQA